MKAVVLLYKMPFDIHTCVHVRSWLAGSPSASWCSAIKGATTCAHRSSKPQGGSERCTSSQSGSKCAPSLGAVLYSQNPVHSHVQVLQDRGSGKCFTFRGVPVEWQAWEGRGERLNVAVPPGGVRAVNMLSTLINVLGCRASGTFCKEGKCKGIGFHQSRAFAMGETGLVQFLRRKQVDGGAW